MSVVATNGSPPASPEPKKELQKLSIDGISLGTAEVTLRGTSPLIMHRWSEKARKQMRDKQTGHGSTKKGAKVIEEDFLDAIYFLDRVTKPDGTVDLVKSTYGFPVIAFKAACASSFNFVEGMKKTVIRGAFHIINGEDTADGRLVEIFTSTPPVMMESMVRVGMGVADLRHRPIFANWSTKLRCQYNTRVVTISALVNLFENAGFSVGVGEWRPEKDGTYGRFTVDKS